MVAVLQCEFEAPVPGGSCFFPPERLWDVCFSYFSYSYRVPGTRYQVLLYPVHDFERTRPICCQVRGTLAWFTPLVCLVSESGMDLASTGTGQGIPAGIPHVHMCQPRVIVLLVYTCVYLANLQPFTMMVFIRQLLTVSCS